MKYIKKEVAKNGGDKYHIYFGKEEINLLKVLINHYKNNIPRCPETIMLVGRLRNLANELAKIKY